MTLGLHLIGPDNLCRFAGWDFDQHDETDPGGVAERNFAQALALYGRLEALGLVPLLEDSNGKGGFHIWVFFDRPVLARDLHAWVRGLASEGSEAFPKQAGVSPTPGKGHYGNYLRLPGRHHKRPHWSRFYITGEWFEGEEAVTLFLEWTPSDAALIPDAPPFKPHTPVDPAPVSSPRASPISRGPMSQVDTAQLLDRLSPARA